MPTRFSVPFLLLVLTGCATLEEDLATARQSWEGAPYEQVVREWGAPARSTKLENGDAVHTWTSRTSYARPGPSIGVGVFGASGGRHSSSGVGIGVGGPIGQSEGAVECERTLVFRESRVVEQTWRGVPEYCAGFRRR
jgi:hypothetical protein